MGRFSKKRRYLYLDPAKGQLCIGALPILSGYSQKTTTAGGSATLSTSTSGGTRTALFNILNQLRGQLGFDLTLSNDYSWTVTGPTIYMINTEKPILIEIELVGGGVLHFTNNSITTAVGDSRFTRGTENAVLSSSEMHSYVYDLLHESEETPSARTIKVYHRLSTAYTGNIDGEYKVYARTTSASTSAKYVISRYVPLLNFGEVIED